MTNMKMIGKVLFVIQLIAAITYSYVLIGVAAPNHFPLDFLFPFSVCHRMYLFLIKTQYITFPILAFTIFFSAVLIFRKVREKRKMTSCLFCFSITNILLLIVLIVFTICAIQSVMGI